MPRNNRRGSKNNNPEGRNQYSDWGVMDMARERPMAAAAAAAGAAAAGLFLWSRRSQISQQLSNLSDQIGEWTDNMRSGDSADMIDDTAGLTTSSRSKMRSGAGSRSGSGMSSTTTRTRGMSETGGGNASLGARSGGGGIRTNASSRGRAKGIPSTT
jgi:hypothetical protein